MALLGIELFAPAKGISTFFPCLSCRMRICAAEKLDRLPLEEPAVCPPKYFIALHIETKIGQGETYQITQNTFF